MLIQVKLLRGYQKILTYKVPSSWDKKESANLVGTVVTVPLKNMVVPALVLATSKKTVLSKNFEIKEVIGKDHLPPDKLYPNFIKKIAQFYMTPPQLFYQRIRSFVEKSDTTRKRRENKNATPTKKQIKQISLTEEQKIACDHLNKKITENKYSPTLLHGVTGSGKTEVYKKIIATAIKDEKTVILLLPEVSLSLQFENLLRKQLPQDIPIFGFHSASKAKTKKELWQKLINSEPTLIIGVHLPVMLPIPNLGLIIVDEEHETGFQEKKHPKMNSKEIAIWRAKMHEIPILLGSATPSINSLYNVETRNWKKFTLKKRFSGAFPKIKIVPIKASKNFWFTKELEQAIAERLEKKEQTLIFLNRRGYSFFVQCKKCGHTFLCPNCSVSLTPHKTNDAPSLKCHYCDHVAHPPKSCPECQAKGDDLRQRGIGTQQAVTILQEMFPSARIARADLDTTKKKREWTETVEKFEAGEIDILVGTQTITKGYHFPKVTLVGILWADLNVHFPIFNASETALQQLIQVAGRAGRNNEKSLVIAQTMHDHPIFDFLREEDYTKFCKQEAAFRKETSYPPFGRFLQIEIKHSDKKTIDQEADKLTELLMKKNNETGDIVTVLGPAEPLVSRIKKTEIRHIFLKSKAFSPIYKLLQSIDHSTFESQIFIVPTV